MFSENFPEHPFLPNSNQQTFQDKQLIKSNCLNVFHMLHGQMGDKHTSGGWKLSKYIHWPKLVLEFFTLWLRFQLVKELFPNHITI